ncbi:MAG TPA: DNA/RNA non-specific endonuclease [Candidatus Ozemobacteraceae bacterium]
MTSDLPGPKPPPNGSRNHSGSPGQPRLPLVKKGPQGWQLPLDPAIRVERRNSLRRKPAPPDRTVPYVLLAGLVLLVVLAGCLITWRESIEELFQKRPARPRTEAAGAPPALVTQPSLPATHTIQAVRLPAASGTPLRHPQVIPIPLSISRAPIPASQPTALLPALPALPEPAVSLPPGPAGEGEAYRQTLGENNLIFAGKPRAMRPDVGFETLYNRAYATGYSRMRREALWVGYRLDRALPGGSLPRPKSFFPDPRLKEAVKPGEYTHSGFDRGHLAPNAAIARRFGAEAQRETFLMSNIVPQRPALNRNLWQRLERLEEDLADRFDHLYILTGPIFDSRREMLSGSSDVEIPDELYKILLDEEAGTVRMLAFRVPQTVSGREPLEQFLTSVDDIEQATGLDFFWALSDPCEEQAEAVIPREIWGENPDRLSLITPAE